jgi:predicted DNA-binding WGR domain protein
MPPVRRFEFVRGTSSKFWEISQSDSEVTVHFGRIGTKGQTQTKDLGSWDTAAERVRNLVHEKLREGYKEVGGQRSREETREERKADLPPYEVPPIPDDGSVTIGKVQLPPGRRLKADPKFPIPGVATITQPVIWVTDAPMHELFIYFASRRRR